MKNRAVEVVELAKEWFISLTKDELMNLLTKHHIVNICNTEDIVDLFVKEGLVEKYKVEVNKQIDLENKFKFLFQDFFQGTSDYSDPVYETYIHISKFQISDLVFIHSKDDKNILTIEIHTVCPGILIGKGGRTIDALTKYLNDCLELEIKITLKEVNIWKIEKHLK